MLIHCGDFCLNGEQAEFDRFNEQFSRQPHRHKLVVAGNHDAPVLKSGSMVGTMFDSSIIFLDDRLVEIEGFTFFGGKWRGRLMRRLHARVPLQKVIETVFGLSLEKDEWHVAPKGTDVLITHGPPFEILDRTELGHHAGCEVLKARVTEIAPAVHCFGHIHDSYGYRQTASTLFVNAASVDTHYRCVNKPQVIELKKGSPPQIHN